MDSVRKLLDTASYIENEQCSELSFALPVGTVKIMTSSREFLFLLFPVCMRWRVHHGTQKGPCRVLENN